MHYFDKSVNLRGLKGIFKKSQFYLPNAQRPTRTCEILGGPGCTHEKQGTTLEVRWLSDGLADTVDAHALEAYIDADGKTVERADDEKPTGVLLAVPRGGEKPKAEVPVSVSEVEPSRCNCTPGQTPDSEWHVAGSEGCEQKEAPKHTAVVTEKPARKVAAPADGFDYAAAFEIAKSEMRDPNRPTCKAGHPICLENANPANLRRGNVYRCLPCIQGYTKK